MKRIWPALLLLAACSGPGAGVSTTTIPAPTTTTVGVTTTDPPPECPEAPYDLGTLPSGVGAGELVTDNLEPDVWTSVPGSNTTFVPRDDGSVAIALVRGTLPPVDWPGEKGEVSIDGTRAAVGPHPDGTWVAGWFEEPGERCDLYTMVFYPPWSPSDVEAVLAGMNRVGG
ncbi:MAG TPA: hypothetical protein VG872_03995 [Acidimicrobiia bacterium]|jgi:hypothetical protein|nr:hypothetical protein [Acidimicrobiia bacterium]